MWLATLVVWLLLAVGLYAWAFGPAYVACWRYEPQEGDIVFQSLPRSRLVNAIEGVSDSPYSHCGIVTREGGQWVVLEAFHKVEVTPLRRFIFRGRQEGFAAYRLHPDCQAFVPETIACARRFLGRPYDTRYQLDDDRIYCSELIYKAYLEASGEALGELSRLGDLNWRPYEETIRHYEQGPVPLDRELITPRRMAEADQLELVFAHNLAAH